MLPSWLRLLLPARWLVKLIMSPGSAVLSLFTTDISSNCPSNNQPWPGASKMWKYIFCDLRDHRLGLDGGGQWTPSSCVEICNNEPLSRHITGLKLDFPLNDWKIEEIIFPWFLKPVAWSTPAGRSVVGPGDACGDNSRGDHDGNAATFRLLVILHYVTAWVGYRMTAGGRKI